MKHPRRPPTWITRGAPGALAAVFGVGGILDWVGATDDRWTPLLGVFGPVVLPVSIVLVVLGIALLASWAQLVVVRAVDLVATGGVATLVGVGVVAGLAGGSVHVTLVFGLGCCGTALAGLATAARPTDEDSSDGDDAT